MFACDRLPVYKANLDDILHVSNASDVTSDSYDAKENFLNQLENENNKIGKANDDDLLDALDQSLYQIYKGSVADWEPLSSSFNAEPVQQKPDSPCVDVVDIPPFVDGNISIAALNSDSTTFSENGSDPANSSAKPTKETAKTNDTVVKRKRTYKKRQKTNSLATSVKKSPATLVPGPSGSIVYSCNNATCSINIKPIQVATVCSSTAVAKRTSYKQGGIIAPDAESLLDYIEKHSQDNKDEESIVSSSTDKFKRCGAILIDPLCVKKRKQSPVAPTTEENEIIRSIQSSNRHLADHNYCLVVPTSEIVFETESTIESPKPSMDITSSKSPAACKILKWQDYLQRVRLGVRSAPNSPTTSPKIPRGAARKVNNFMVMEGADNVKFLMPIQPQAPKPPSPLLDPLTAVKVQTKAKTTPIQLQEFEEYMAKLETKQKTPSSDSSSEATSPVLTDSPGSMMTTSPLSQVQTNSNCDVFTDESSSSVDAVSSSVSKQVVTIHISPDSSTSAVTTCEKNSETQCDEKEQTSTTISAADPRKAVKSKPKQPVTVLKPISSVQWRSISTETQNKPAKKSAPSFKLVSTGKDGATAKSLVLNNVTGKLEEILSSLVKQQQQGPSSQNPEATAQQQETLQQLLTAISNLQSKDKPASTAATVTTFVPTHHSACTKTIVSCSKAARQVKKAATVPSPMSLIHEIKQNISRKNSSESNQSQPNSLSSSQHNLRREIQRKISSDIPTAVSTQNQQSTANMPNFNSTKTPEKPILNQSSTVVKPIKTATPEKAVFDQTLSVSNPTKTSNSQTPILNPSLPVSNPIKPQIPEQPVFKQSSTAPNFIKAPTADRAKPKANSAAPNTPKAAEKPRTKASDPHSSTVQNNSDDRTGPDLYQEALRPVSNDFLSKVQATPHIANSTSALDSALNISPQRIPVLITSKPCPTAFDHNYDCVFDYTGFDHLGEAMAADTSFLQAATLEQNQPAFVTAAQETLESDTILVPPGTCEVLLPSSPLLEQNKNELNSQEVTIATDMKVVAVKIEIPDDFATALETNKCCVSSVEVPGEETKSAKDIEDGEITTSDAEHNNEANELENPKAIGSQPNVDHGEIELSCKVEPISDFTFGESESQTETVQDIVPTIPARHAVIHQDGLFGVQQKRGLKFSSEVRTPVEPEVFSDNVDPHIYETDTSSQSSHHKREKRKKSKRRKRKHKKRKRKHHRHHHHSRRESKRSKYDDDSSSDSSPERGRRWQRRKRHISEDSYSSAGYSSSEYERSRSPLPQKRRRYSRDSYSSRRKRSLSSFSRSRSRSPRRSWKNERNDDEGCYRDSLSRSPSLERSESRRKGSYDWDELSRRRVYNREMKDKAIKERRVMYVGRIADTATKFFLRRRFQKFGKIDNVELYFRNFKDSYAFVTFHHTRDAYNAIEKGNEGEKEVYDLCFGGRRQFCQTNYADLDDEDNNGAEHQEEEDDFDTLLRKAMKH